MAVLLKEALRPEPVKTLENTPAIVNAGPFAISRMQQQHLGDQIGFKGRRLS